MIEIWGKDFTQVWQKAAWKAGNDNNLTLASFFAFHNIPPLPLACVKDKIGEWKKSQRKG